LHDKPRLKGGGTAWSIRGAMSRPVCGPGGTGADTSGLEAETMFWTAFFAVLLVMLGALQVFGPM